MIEPQQILLTHEQLQKRVRELGAQITKDHLGKEIVVVGVLKGAFVFMADLIRQIGIPLTCEFLGAASYEDGQSTGIVRLDPDLSQDVSGKHVLLVEDIIDTGLTIRYLIDHLRSKKPASLRVCAMLCNETHPDIHEEIDYIGFTIPNVYVVGYGLDYNEMYRYLPYVAKIKSK